MPLIQGVAKHARALLDCNDRRADAAAEPSSGTAHNRAIFRDPQKESQCGP